jgi:hypothetical protein
MKSIKRKNLGADLVEYVIPIAVLGLLIGLGLYNLVDSGNLQSFIEGSTGGNVDVDTLIIE